MCSCEIGAVVGLPDCVESDGCSAWLASCAVGSFFARVRLNAGFNSGSGLAVLCSAAAVDLVPLVAFFLDAVFDSMAFFSLSDFCSFGIRKYGLEFAQIGGSGVAGCGHLSQVGRARLVAVGDARKCAETGGQFGVPAGRRSSLPTVTFS